MTKTSSLLSSYHPTSSYSLVTIALGQPCLIKGHGTTYVNPSLYLQQIFYVPSFPMNLLSINAITCAFPCAINFFPFHYVFQYLYTKQRIGFGHENERGIYELILNEPSSSH